MDDVVDKAKIPALSLPRRYSRLPHGKARNPFKAGTSKIAGRVKRALAAHGAALAANHIPGKAIAAGVIGHHMGGPGGAAAAASATELASIGASALLARSVARRSKAAIYLARRRKRATGVYKSREASMDALDALDEAIAKARGLIPRGGSSKLRDALSHRGYKAYRRIARDGTGASHRELARASRAVRYLGDRKKSTVSTGLSNRTKNSHFRLWGRRSGVYKAADAFDTLSEAIEKAKRGPINGGSKHPNKLMRRYGGRMNNRDYLHANRMYQEFGDKGVRQFLRFRRNLTSKS